MSISGPLNPKNDSVMQEIGAVHKKLNNGLKDCVGLADSVEILIFKISGVPSISKVLDPSNPKNEISNSDFRSTLDKLNQNLKACQIIVDNVEKLAQEVIDDSLPEKVIEYRAFNWSSNSSYESLSDNENVKGVNENEETTISLSLTSLTASPKNIL